MFMITTDEWMGFGTLTGSMLDALEHGIRTHDFERATSGNMRRYSKYLLLDQNNNK